MVGVKLLYFVAIFIAMQPFSRALSQKQQLNYFLTKAGIQQKQFNFQGSRNGQMTYTNLDNFRDLLIDLRVIQMQLYLQNEKFINDLHRRQGRMQPLIPETERFPCELNGSRSKEVPTSVNRLRPGDIDIIAAMGDSLTAGTDILSDTVLQESAEFRGVSFLGGGLKDWRTYLTLPNILKVYNPNLYGYAIENTLARERPARFIVGEPNALTQDMPFQAHVLVRRIQMDPKVDMQKHWKLINLLIGSNDFCTDLCYYDDWENFVENHRKDMYKTLNILKTNLPRTLVNLMPALNVLEFRSMRNIPISCFAIQRLACSCVIGKRWSPAHLKKVDRYIKRVQQIDEEIAALPEFQTQDFAVAFRSFSANYKLYKYEDGSTDLRYFADDCFHLSQLGNAIGAQSLWSNMVHGAPSESNQRLFEYFACPTAERPYIATLNNSMELK